MCSHASRSGHAMVVCWWEGEQERYRPRLSAAAQHRRPRASRSRLPRSPMCGWAAVHTRTTTTRVRVACLVEDFASANGARRVDCRYGNPLCVYCLVIVCTLRLPSQVTGPQSVAFCSFFGHRHCAHTTQQLLRGSLGARRAPCGARVAHRCGGWRAVRPPRPSPKAVI